MLGKIIFIAALMLSVVFLIAGVFAATKEFILIGILGFFAAFLIYKIFNVSFKQDED